MGKGRFLNQKLAKRTGFRERQAANRLVGVESRRGGAKPARLGAEQRAIIGRNASRRKS